MSFFAVIFTVYCQILRKGDEQMKKYIILFSVTFLILAVISMSGYMLSGTAASVDVMTVKPRDMDNIITSGGKLQYRSGRAVKAEYAGIMDELHVKNGSEVKKGDPLFSYYKIDDAYTALISEYSGIEDAESLLSAAAKYGNSSDIINEIKKYCQIVQINSPGDGKVTDLSLKQDDIFTKNTTVLKLSEEQSMEIPLNINEAYIGSISKGQKADIVFNADRTKHYSAEVSDISDEATVTSGLTGKETTVEIKLRLDKNDDTLRAGYSAECTIVTSTDKSVIVLPYELIRSDDEGDYVFTAEGNIARKTPVVTGKEYKDGIEIKQGLSENDTVITGSSDLYDGQKLEINERTVQSDA